MKTLELTEALTRLEQDGEDEVARAARRELDALTARVAELEAGMEGLKQHANAMLYIFDRALPDQSIGRNACDNLHNAIKAADKLLDAK